MLATLETKSVLGSWYKFAGIRTRTFSLIVTSLTRLSANPATQEEPEKLSASARPIPKVRGSQGKLIWLDCRWGGVAAFQRGGESPKAGRAG
jgi:hypothetical protein